MIDGGAIAVTRFAEGIDLDAFYEPGYRMPPIRCAGRCPEIKIDRKSKKRRGGLLVVRRRAGR